jgi:hypothetical protein
MDVVNRPAERGFSRGHRLSRRFDADPTNEVACIGLMPRLDGVGAWRRGARCPRPTLDLYDIEPSAAPQELAVAIATGTFAVHRRPLGSREPDMVII